MTYDPPTPEEFRRALQFDPRIKNSWRGLGEDYYFGVIRQGIIFVHQQFYKGNIGSAFVILDPNAEILIHNSAFKFPIPKSGGMLEIYRSGLWIGEDGSWRRVIVEVVRNLLREHAEIKAADEQRARERRLIEQDAQRALFEKARQAMAARGEV